MYIIRAFDSVSNNENVDVQQVISAQTVTDGRVTALESTRAFNDKLSMPKGEYITIASTDTTVFGVYPIRKNAVATITKQYCTYNAYFLYAQSASVS